MQSGKDMVEQFFHARTEPVEVAYRHCREIVSLYVLPIVSNAIIAKPHRKEVRKPVTEIVSQTPNQGTPRKMFLGVAFACL